MKRTAYTITFLITATISFACGALDEEWWQQAQYLLDEDRVDAALYILEDTSGRINEIEQPIQQVDTLRYLGELYQAAGKTAIADEKFNEALRRSLELTPAWRQFSAVISVLKLHRKAVDDHRHLQPLLQKTLDHKLLTAVSHNTQAKEIGRYIQCFDKAGTQSQVLLLLNELHEISTDWLRKHALFALSKITVQKDHYFGREPMPAANYDADAYERFLWNYVLARLHDVKHYSAQYQEYREAAKSLAEQLDKDTKPQAYAMLRKLR